MNKQYIAGFIDGEGWIGIAKTKNMMADNQPRYFPECRITNTSIKVLNELKKDYPIGTHITHPKKNIGKQEIYQIKFYGNALINLLDDINPYLKIKKKQSLIVLKMVNTMTNKRKKLTKKILSQREGLYQESRKLNTPFYIPTEANLPILEAREQ